MHEGEQVQEQRVETGAVLWIVRGAWWLIAEDGTVTTDGPVPWPAPSVN